MPDPRERTANPEPSGADAVLEVYGLSCGRIEPAIKARIKELESGQVLEVIADEPAAREGIPAWSRLTGNELLAAVEEDAQRTRFYLRRK
jgi:tRNA 2-thiouridine synthesizing protein A